MAARGTFRVTHLRPFRLAGGGAGRSVTLDVLALAGDEPGLALGLVTEWRPAGRDDGAVVSQRLRTGAALLAGGALALHGVADPASPERDLVVVARIGRRVHAGAAPTPPEPTTPEPAAGQFVAEYRLPRSVARVEEINAVVLPLPDAPLPARRAALRARLDAAAVGAASLEVRGERILVVGPESAHEGVRALLDRLASVQAPQRFRIEAFVMTRATEASLFEALPRVSKGADDAVASAVVSDGRALAAARRVLAGGAREVPLTEPIVSGPPTVRLDAPHVVRTAYRSELDTAPGEATSWGRAQTSVIDQGFVLSLRSFGRDARDRDDLDVSLRMVRVIGRDARDRRTALGDVRLLEPRTETVVADLPAVLGARDVLVLAALPSPFSENDDVRIIFLVTPLP